MRGRVTLGMLTMIGLEALFEKRRAVSSAEEALKEFARGIGAPH